VGEILRQWSTFHPEFAYLPRKFKIAVNGATHDRAVIQAHDIGLDLKRDADGNIGFRVLVGGGLGRTPDHRRKIAEFVPWQHILTYCEAILRVYNRFGRRDNMYKARIKILVKAMGIDGFREQVDAEWAHLKNGPSTLTEAEVERVAQHFVDPDYETLPEADAGYLSSSNRTSRSRPGPSATCAPTSSPATPCVMLSTKQRAMSRRATPPIHKWIWWPIWADRYSFGEVRVTHEQNLVLADVKQSDLYELWQQLRDAGLATPNIGL
jgi:sulfite reductase (NADPH) hemoprotein beta-component